jgi:DedD protein
METAAKERLVGAAVLVTVVVLVVPAVLTGPRQPAPAPAPGTEDLRRVEIDLASPGRANDGAPPASDLPGPAQAIAAAPASQAQPAPPVATEANPEEPLPAPALAVQAPAGAAADIPGQGWAVQVAALASREAATRMVADLKLRGFAAFVVEHSTDGRLLYRVRIGPEAERARADALAGQLRSAGFEPAVVASP